MVGVLGDFLQDKVAVGELRLNFVHEVLGLPLGRLDFLVQRIHLVPEREEEVELGDHRVAPVLGQTRCLRRPARVGLLGALQRSGYASFARLGLLGGIFAQRAQV